MMNSTTTLCPSPSGAHTAPVSLWAHVPEPPPQPEVPPGVPPMQPDREIDLPPPDDPGEGRDPEPYSDTPPLPGTV